MIFRAPPFDVGSPIACLNAVTAPLAFTFGALLELMRCTEDDDPDKVELRPIREERSFPGPE